MSWPADARAWMRGHPRASDVGFAVLVAIPSMLVPADAPTGIAAATPVSTLLVLIACAALVVRRGHPVVVWVATLLVAVVAVAVQAGPTGALFPALVALYTVALLRPRREAVLAGIATVVTVITALGVFDDWRSPTTYIVLAWVGLAVSAGFAVGSQRAVVAAAEERAQRAEATREEEAERRVTEERLRIARELHDVVAHHISVINVQSGVALHLLDEQPEQARAALGHVREASRDVLAEMSSLLGVLRSNDDGTETAPAPGLGELDSLVESMRRTGLQVTVREEGGRPSLAPIADLAAYRVVQEALTNAYKHGVGSADLRIVDADPTVVIEVTNPVTGAAVAGSGLGLVGMRERVLASGGHLEAGPDGAGAFRVRVELPASSRAAS